MEAEWICLCGQMDAPSYCKGGEEEMKATIQVI